MAITKNYNRQAVATAVQEVALADFADVAAQAAVELPAGAIVVRGTVIVTESFNAVTTATIKVGDAADDDRYTAAALDVKAVGTKTLTANGFSMAKKGDLLLTYASTGGAATTGKLLLVVEYVVAGKSDWTQG